MIVVPSISPRTPAEARRLLRHLTGRAALAELRLDGLPSCDIHHLLGGKRPPVIVTYRHRAEGGRYAGSAGRTLTRLAEALAAGAEFIDVSERLGRRAIVSLTAICGGGRIILSRHDLARTPANAGNILRTMTMYRPAIVKYAAVARSFRDTVRITALLREAKRRRQPAVAIAMGEYGTYTRVLQGRLGGALSFASHPPEGPAAAGQLPFGDMVDLYRAASIDSRTRIFGLVGNPVSSSPGTRFHNAIFTRLKRNAVYVNFLVDDLEDFMSSVGSTCAGLSVTMPFKRAILPFIDRMDRSAEAAGSVNTVVRRSGKSLGINTDYLAFLSLLGGVTSLRGQRLLVLGTGGTARSVAAAAARSGAHLTVAGRNPKKARELAGEFGGSWVQLAGKRLPPADILVNATPVGMESPSGAGRRGRIVPASYLRGSMVVCDFANPRGSRSPLASDALTRRCRVITGAEIFIAQAGLQSEYFLASWRPG